MLRLSQKTEKRLYRLSELKNEPVEKLLENIINEYIEDDLLATAIEITCPLLCCPFKTIHGYFMVALLPKFPSIHSTVAPS